MPTPPNFPNQFQLKLSGWKAIAVGLIILASVIAALALLAVSFFILILPLIILTPVLYYFVPKLKPARSMKQGATSQTATGDIIDADYTVVDGGPVQTEPKKLDVNEP